MNKLQFYVTILSSLGTPACKQVKRCLSSTELSKLAREVNTLPLRPSWENESRHSTHFVSTKKVKLGLHNLQVQQCRKDESYKSSDDT